MCLLLHVALSLSKLHVSLCLIGLQAECPTLCDDAGHDQVVNMAAAFAKLPCKVLWRLTSSEMPDASASFRLGNNTKVHTPATLPCAWYALHTICLKSCC